MITVLLNGGLGNQLFQYATGRALAERHGVELRLDLSRLEHPEPGDTRRNFELSSLCINASIISDTDRKPCGKYKAVLNRQLLKAGLPGFGYIVLREQSCRFDPLILKAPFSCALEGFWQSERYFGEIAPLLQQELRLKQASKTWLESVSSLPDSTVALHVRRGDYITNPAAARFHGTCSRDYYRKAVGILLQHHPDSRLIVFSDDPAWCLEHLDIGQPFRLAADFGLRSPAEELMMISCCAHQIIANSSFSWWGAWLNKSPHKMVIAPSRWFADTRIYTGDLVPGSWVRL